MMRSLVVALAIVALLGSGCSQIADRVIDQVADTVAEQVADRVPDLTVDARTEEPTPAAADKPTTTVRPDAPKPSVTAPDAREGAVVQEKDGVTVTTSSEKIPDELKGIPVPGGFEFEGGGSMAVEGGESWFGAWEGRSSAKSVIEFYKETMPGLGWQEGFAMVTGQGGMLMFTNADDHMLQVIIDGDDDAANIAVALTKLPPEGQTASPAADGKVDEKTETVTISDKEGTTTFTASAELPDALKNFPAPPGLQFESGSVTKSGGEVMTQANWTGKGSVKEMTEHLKETLPKQGWQEEFAMMSGDGGMLMYTDTDGDGLMVTIGKEGDDGIGLFVVLTKSE